MYRETLVYAFISESVSDFHVPFVVVGVVLPETPSLYRNLPRKGGSRDSIVGKATT